MDYGVWTENSRGTYNKWDGVARCTTQVCMSLNFSFELLTIAAVCELPHLNARMDDDLVDRE